RVHGKHGCRDRYALMPHGGKDRQDDTDGTAPESAQIIKYCRLFLFHLISPLLKKKLTDEAACEHCVFWRRVWDSNPRAREDYCISSAARYDRFDNSPFALIRSHLLKA